MSRVMPGIRGGVGSITDKEMREAKRVKFVEGQNEGPSQADLESQAAETEKQNKSSESTNKANTPNSIGRYKIQGANDNPSEKATPKSVERYRSEESTTTGQTKKEKPAFKSDAPELKTPFPKSRPVAADEFSTGGSASSVAGDEPRGIEFRSMPRLSQAAFGVARRWRGVTDDISDEDALAQGIISPELIQLIMTIVMDLFQNCLNNSPVAAHRAIRNYVENPKEMDKIGDTIRLNWMVDRWFNRLGTPRDRGDVVAVRKAITEAAEGLSQQDLAAVQTEVLFLTV